MACNRGIFSFLNQHSDTSVTPLCPRIHLKLRTFCSIFSNCFCMKTMCASNDLHAFLNFYLASRILSICVRILILCLCICFFLANFAQIQYLRNFKKSIHYPTTMPIRSFVDYLPVMDEFIIHWKATDDAIVIP